MEFLKKEDMQEDLRRSFEKLENEYEELYVVICTYKEIETGKTIEPTWIVYTDMEDIKRYIGLCKAWYALTQDEYKCITSTDEELIEEFRMSNGYTCHMETKVYRYK